MNLTDMIKAVQKARGVTPDGFAGPATWTAIYQHEVRLTQMVVESPTNVVNVGDPADPRSEKAIATLLPHVRPYARALITEAASVGITIKIISGTRTYAEQNELYAKGRTAPGPKVTNARGGFSNHNFGVAWDVGVFEGGKYIEESPKYKVVGALGIKLGLEWGGSWVSLTDEPHYQLTGGKSLAQLRAEHDA